MARPPTAFKPEQVQGPTVQPATAPDFIGVDGARGRIGVAGFASGRHGRVMTTKQEPNCFAASVKGPLVVPEASGGCEAMRPRRLHGQQIGPTLKALRQDRQDRGKPGKLARTACARKRRTIGNAMFRDGTAHADARAR